MSEAVKKINETYPEELGDYTKWHQEYFGSMTEEEFFKDLNDFLKTHPDA